MLPGVSDLEVAKPRRSIKCALLVVGVERLQVLPAQEVIRLVLHALVRVVIEIGREMSLEHVTIHADHVAVHQAHEVLTAHIKHVVTRVVMLMHLHAASTEEGRDVVLAEERRSYFEAATTTECTIDVIFADNGIADHMVVLPEHLLRNVIEWVDLAWADLRVVELDAVAQEQLVQFFNFGAGTEEALVSPEVLEVITAHPLIDFLIQVSQRCLETVAMW
mmetsp:Transcript_31292/g.38706  ORF Transcript_31292/g.38706 Transcript_31292/m.38706 type:complete len:220 (-) Transcript_31292:260-919(-)|eukprot:CAMPEP_0170466006 /NCGR_PEP_ID=MMETSP0123-20130129/10141_1 /TAXON_ID=182087 /ORGANISM="Favella ehrenbergii, Strain Fehren 1" /LENGTH=219 /DNA_ID=CAMNT_0010732053 /DNA_START=419 /DNA_END=1078 /DNA_ORIENTATION=-